jgi:hypothetical protein
MPLPHCLAHPQRSLCRRRRYPQPGDLRQDVGEHLPRHRDLGHLEGDVAPVGNDLRADLDQFSRRLVSDHGAAVFGIARVRMKLPRLYASAWSWRRTALAAKVRHDSRVHLIAFLPSLMYCSAVPRWL